MTYKEKTALYPPDLFHTSKTGIVAVLNVWNNAGSSLTLW